MGKGSAPGGTAIMGAQADGWAAVGSVSCTPPGLLPAN